MLSRTTIYAVNTPESAERGAENRNCTIEWSNDNVLQLDLDGDEQFRRFRTLYDVLMEHGVIPGMGMFHKRYSRSGKHYHVTIPLAVPQPIEQRILLQALLGSDQMRELLSYIGLKQGVENPVLLYRPKED